MNFFNIYLEIDNYRKILFNREVYFFLIIFFLRQKNS